jgi:predicted acylesterase/phospholipase RssA
MNVRLYLGNSIMIRLNNQPAKKIATHLPVFLLGLCLNACSIMTINTMKNDPLMPQQASKVNGNKPPFGDDVFIGIAMSGGGSRATNFSAAVLLELEKLGILQHADVISSVSGSSLTAAYYGLYGNNKNSDHRWDEASVREAFLTDFQSGWFRRWFNPWNVMRYWLTNFTRSDIMIENLNDELYDDNTYTKLIGRTPQIIINATSYTNGEPFIFTPEHFKERLNSRLDTYPVANAVMASSAFPGVFHPVTVKDYSLKNTELAGSSDETQYYEHLIDGGPYDNLGVSPIIKILQEKALLTKEKRNSIFSKAQSYTEAINEPLNDKSPKACLLVVIDAYPYSASANGIRQANTREVVDYFFDSGTVLSSTDAMLARNRKFILEKTTNFNSEDIGFRAFNENAKLVISDSNEEPVSCVVWHLSFQRLYDLQFEWSYARRNINKLQYLDRVRKIVNSIPTRYKLVGSMQGDKPSTVQDYIFKAANMLVKEDIECNREDNECIKNKRANMTYQRVCDFLKGWRLNVSDSCYY